MTLKEIFDRLIGVEGRVQELEQTKQPNVGLLEAMLREQMRKKQQSPLDPPDWFEPRLY